MKYYEVRLEQSEISAFSFRERRLQNLLSQILPSQKNVRSKTAQFVIYPGANLLEIKDKTMISELEQSLIGVMSRIAERSGDTPIVLSGSKPKFSRPLYRFDRVLTLHAMKLSGNVDQTSIKSLVKKYLTGISSGPSFLDNKGFDFAEFIKFLVGSNMPTNKTIYVFDSVKIDRALCEDLCSQSNSLIFVRRTDRLPEVASKTKIGSRTRLTLDFKIINKSALPVIFDNLPTSKKIGFSIKTINFSSQEKTLNFLYGKESEVLHSLVVTVCLEGDLLDSNNWQLRVSINHLNDHQFVQAAKKVTTSKTIKCHFSNLNFADGTYKLFVNLCSIDGGIIKHSYPIYIKLGSNDAWSTQPPYAMDEGGNSRHIIN